ncbi:hypothetical protein DUNSADRAFT_2904 [Dunaliella salina]|uniref:tRNA-uridine aminocarboxypropyltransferase 1 n=1 Tax=Dunaliella salina TaxID=3046 RepID=A0ABQ7GUZ3_DUNSA|nr:hypothetical protein DUNSADRAFT_2904 [Dunaliella salina]|eukprot:KAF5838436.1 hypothetical protein DUNSADRAFT_2904 [Dunaliella salina]
MQAAAGDGPRADIEQYPTTLDACPPFDASRAVVLYPSDDAVDVGQLEPNSIDRVFIIDSKWKESKEMMKHPSLSGVRRVRLKDARSAFWRFHTAGVGEEGLCTIECLFFFLRALVEQGKIFPPASSAAAGTPLSRQAAPSSMPPQEAALASAPPTAAGAAPSSIPVLASAPSAAAPAAPSSIPSQEATLVSSSIPVHEAASPASALAPSAATPALESAAAAPAPAPPSLAPGAAPSAEAQALPAATPTLELAAAPAASAPSLAPTAALSAAVQAPSAAVPSARAALRDPVAPSLDHQNRQRDGAEGEGAAKDAATCTEDQREQPSKGYDPHAFDDLLWLFCCQHNHVSKIAAQRLEQHKAKKAQSLSPVPEVTGHSQSVNKRRKKK